MTKKYFVISDLHSFYTETKAALKQAGYDKKNKDHILIICGDIFDRGLESVELFKFIQSVPKSRRILITGNHELLLKEAINRGFFYQNDLNNGTVQTVMDFLNVDWKTFVHNQKDCCEKFKELPVWKWVNSDEWVWFYELNNFIFVHSFIPLHNPTNTPIYGNFNYNDYLVYDSNWRDVATTKEYEEATWGCPHLQFEAGLFDEEIKNNKVLVCGHWSTKDMHEHFNKDHMNHSIYNNKNLIGLDACTALSKNINVLVIEDNKCFDKFNHELSM